MRFLAALGMTTCMSHDFASHGAIGEGFAMLSRAGMCEACPAHRYGDKGNAR